MIQKPRILFVDDEPSVLRGIQRSLWEMEDEWDMEFCELASGALSALENQTADVLVTDHNMPGKTGLQLLEELRQNPNHDAMLVVFLTGNNEQSLKRQALDAGANDLLNKPVSTEDLIARIQSCLSLKAAQDALRSQNELLEARVVERTAQLEAAQFEIVYRLAKTTELRDAETGNHNLRVAYASKIISEALGYSPEFQRQLFLAAMLHDIGKIGIRDEVLLKPGKLTAEEFSEIKNHTLIGEALLASDISIPEAVKTELELVEIVSSPFIQLAGVIASQHHEKFDGTGYPLGLERQEINIAARIVAVADVFDALRSTRPYKQGMSEADAVKILRDGSGTHFDPQVVDAFCDFLSSIREVYLHLQDDFGCELMAA